MIKLSKASKMPCRSWSLQAIDTCPASIGSDGDLVDACKGCYATTGNYNFPNVKAPRIHNKEDWKREEWVADMIAELDNDRYFRWFDSGDMYDLRLAEKILEICKSTPWTRHWIPTRMHKFKKFKQVIDELNKLDNVVVRLSSDGVNGEINEVTYEINGITYITKIGGELDLGSIVGMYLPKCITTELTVSDVDETLTDSISFMATRGEDGTTEEIYIGMI